MNKYNSEFEAAHDKLKLKPGFGEFYGGNHIHITRQNDKQLEKSKYKPFKGPGNLLNVKPRNMVKFGGYSGLTEGYGVENINEKKLDSKIESMEKRILNAVKSETTGKSSVNEDASKSRISGMIEEVSSRNFRPLQQARVMAAPAAESKAIATSTGFSYISESGRQCHYNIKTGESKSRISGMIEEVSSRSKTDNEKDIQRKRELLQRRNRYKSSLPPRNVRTPLAVSRDFTFYGSKLPTDAEVQKEKQEKDEKRKTLIKDDAGARAGKLHAAFHARNSKY